MKTKIFAVSLFSALLIFGVIVGLRSHTEEDPFVTNLMAGQHIDVGDVIVWNDGDYLYVKYLVTAEGWCLTETHLHVAESMEGIPQKKGNPPPGQFTWPMRHACATEYTYEIPLEWDTGTELFIAAHAEMEKILEEFPYYASAVVNYDQGLRKDGGPVREQRSTPGQALALELGKNEFNFFSLGFDGWIIVEFDCPIRNGEGNDVSVWEDTWGGYPLETADVSASQDGVDWTLLGTAVNTTGTPQSPNEFDLVDLERAKYIKVTDTTNPDVHADNADGFDLNAVGSLQDCTREETAWGDGDDFPGKNWATYIMYTLKPDTERFPEEGTVYVGYEDWGNGDFDYNDFGMRFYVEEIYERISGKQYLTEITMTFTPIIYDSGAEHYIHIRRPFEVETSYEYIVTRENSSGDTVTPYSGEIASGSHSDSGELDVILFNTIKYPKPSKKICPGGLTPCTVILDETVTVNVVLLTPELRTEPEPPRSYTVNSTTFTDLAPIMANYDAYIDPYSPPWISIAEWHIDDTQVISNTANQKNSPTLIPTGTETPFVLVIPYPEWIPPFEDTTITGPYLKFLDFYTTGAPENWYDPTIAGMVINTVGTGFLSWGPYPIIP